MIHPMNAAPSQKLPARTPMKSHSSILALLLLLCAPLSAEEKPRAAAAAKTDEPVVVAPILATQRNTSLLKVNVTYQPWNFRIPWQKTPPGSRRGLGVLLEGNRILVTAQMVADATYIELEQAESGEKLTAKVKAVDYEANLALLEPAQSAGEFFKELAPMTLNTAVAVGDELETWQLDRTGEVVITPLKVHKVQVARYFLESSLFLVYETIGIIRSEANSFTLPVIKNGKLTGLLLRYDSKNQTASVLPGPIIQHFLKDIADDNYQGFPSLGIEFQQTLDGQFREYLGMTKEQQGVYVGAVTSGGSADSLGIKEGDILMEMNGKKINARGDYKDPQYGSMNMSHIVRGNSFVGDELKVKVLRDGREMTLSGKLTRKKPKDYLVWPYLFDRGSNYMVMGGLIFQELSMPYLQSFGEDWESQAPLRLAYVAKHTEEYEKAGRKKLVFLGAALPTLATQGYERVGGLIVTKVNDRPINDLNDVNGAFKEPKNGIHKIEFEDFPKVIYLDALAAEKDNIKLLDGVYRIGSLKRIE